MPCVGHYECEEPATVWRESAIRARKPHQCYECHEVIQAGERCDTATWLYDGTWRTAYRCLDCVALADLIATKTGVCPLWGGISETCGDADVDWWEWRSRAKAAQLVAARQALQPPDEVRKDGGPA